MNDRGFQNREISFSEQLMDTSPEVANGLTAVACVELRGCLLVGRGRGAHSEGRRELEFVMLSMLLVKRNCCTLKDSSEGFCWILTSSKGF